jgi:hypothetical protein
MRHMDELDESGSGVPFVTSRFSGQQARRIQGVEPDEFTINAHG